MRSGRARRWRQASGARLMTSPRDACGRPSYVSYACCRTKTQRVRPSRSCSVAGAAAGACAAGASHAHASPRCLGSLAAATGRHAWCATQPRRCVHHGDSDARCGRLVRCADSEHPPLRCSAVVRRRRERRRRPGHAHAMQARRCDATAQTARLRGLRSSLAESPLTAAAQGARQLDELGGLGAARRCVALPRARAARRAAAAASSVLTSQLCAPCSCAGQAGERPRCARRGHRLGPQEGYLHRRVRRAAAVPVHRTACLR
jgi:hypothetical protein